MLRARALQRSPALTEYQTDPIGFMVREMGVPEHTLRWSMNPGYDMHRWDGTRDPLVAIAEGLADGCDVGVESGTGTGKTFAGALFVEWFLACFVDSIVVTIAPKQDQLLLHVWKELARNFPRFKALPVGRNADIHSGKLRMRGGIDETWTATAFVAGVSADEEVSQRAKGFHAEHMLFLFEETPGIPRPIMEAVENTCTGEHNLRLAFGQPDNQQDELHRFCEAPGAVHVRISAHDHPNVVTNSQVVPGAVSRSSIEKRLAKYRTPDHRLYLTQVRGISPAEATDALIRLSWLKRAAEHYDDPRYRVGLPALGVDAANSEDGDKGAIARGQGNWCAEVQAFQCPDASLLGVRVAMLMALYGVLPEHVGVDAGGVGASTVNKLKELGKYVQALHSGSKQWDRVDQERAEETGANVLPEELFRCLRDQMWWQLRIDLEHDRLAIPEDDELFEELTIVRYWTDNGVIRVTPKVTSPDSGKKGVRELLGRSPDKSDSLVYWNWVRRRTPLPEEDPDLGAWTPEALEAEMEQRRVRTVPPRPRVDPMVMAEIE